MAVLTVPKYTDSYLEQIRKALETNGFYEATIIANGFDDDPAVLGTIDGRSLGTTFPVPPDSCVSAEFQVAVYSDESTDSGMILSFVTGGFRDGSGNVAVLEVQNAATTYAAFHTELNSTAADTAADLDVTIAADTTNQGIDVSFDQSASTTSYLVGRMRLVCAKKGGLTPKYYTA